MDDKKQDFKQNLKSYVSDEKIVQPDDYFEEKPVEDVDDDATWSISPFLHHSMLPSYDRI